MFDFTTLPKEHISIEIFNKNYDYYKTLIEENSVEKKKLFYSYFLKHAIVLEYLLLLQAFLVRFHSLTNL